MKKVEEIMKVSLSREDVLCRSKCNVGIIHISTRLRLFGILLYL